MDNTAFIMLSPLWIAFILYILFNTKAVYEYSRFLPEFISLRRAYEEEGRPVGLSYPDYIRMVRNWFVIRMFSCADCLCVWLSLVAAAVAWRWELLPVAFFGGIGLYRGFVALNRWLKEG